MRQTIPIRPETVSARSKALKATQVFHRNLDKVVRLNERGDSERVRAVCDGFSGYVASLGLSPGHLVWALTELARHPEGGRA